MSRKNKFDSLFFAAIVVYPFLTFILFGNPFAPLLWDFNSFEALQLPNYILGVLSAAMSIAFAKSIWVKRPSLARLAPSIFIAGFLMFSFGANWFYFDFHKHKALEALQPDEYHAISFYQSVLELDDLVRYSHHIHAVKDCKYYIWSYRERKFVEDLHEFDLSNHTLSFEGKTGTCTQS